jgi:hypothetical protein
MNKQITTLWEQSAQRDDLWSQARYEKFAELIVRECAERSAKLGQPEIGKGLMKSFGVKE